jgi:hypothetical protein
MATAMLPRRKRGMRLDELLALPVMFNLDTSNRALDIGRTKGFALARDGEYPIPVRRIGAEYRVTRADLLRELGIDPSEGLAGPVSSTFVVTGEGAPVAAGTPSNENASSLTSA